MTRQKNDELLNIFQDVGEGLRYEIDKKFAEFRNASP